MSSHDEVPAKVGVALAVFDAFSQMNSGAAESWEVSEPENDDDKCVQLLNLSINILVEYLS